MFDIATGFTGFTIDIFNGSVSDSEGDVTKALFTITFQERVNPVKFTITDGEDYWSCLTPTGEYIALRNPKVLFTNKNNAVIEFELAEKYPSNSMLILAYRNANATFSVTEIDGSDTAFTPNTISGCMGFTSNEYGGMTDDEGQVERIVFNIPYTVRKNDVDFKITEGEDNWAVLLGDGSYIDLIEPHILYSNRDGATIVFQMKSKYPSNSPGYLVRKKESATWSISEIDEEYPFTPVQNIIFPTYIPAGERLNLSAQTVVYPMNVSIRNIQWSVKDAGETGATIDSGWITTTNPGNLTLTATVVNGKSSGVNYTQDVNVMVITNWINIVEQPHENTYCVSGKIDEEISVIATTEYGDLTYQWYRSGDMSNTYGTAISGATDSTFKIPTNLIPGEYFYFCEVRKVNFPSVRTEVAHVRVRDELFSISIYPSSASIPPGNTQQFAISRNPQTSNEELPVTWVSSDPSIISIDENGLARSYNPGSVIIKARVHGVEASIIAKATYTGVTSIDFTDIGKVIDTGVTYTMPTKVMPSDATYKNIKWTITNSGKTGATIVDNKLTAPKVGDIIIKAVIEKGMTPKTDFEQYFYVSVKLAHIPVTGITLADLGSPRAGSPLILKPTVTPSNASDKDIKWTVESVGTTGAKFLSDGILTATDAGDCIIKATIANGSGENIPFTKTFNISFTGKFIPVDSIVDFPESIMYYDGEEGYEFYASVSPENASHSEIQYKVSPKDNSNLVPQIINNKLIFDATAMTYEDEISIIVQMTVKDGLSEGVDFVTESAIYIDPPSSPSVFVPIISTKMKLPSILRAYRPILMDDTTITPYDATKKSITWGIEPTDDIAGSQAIQFIINDNKESLKNTGVHFDEEFNWDYKGNILYPMSKGGIKVKLEIFDGLGVNESYVKEETINILDPFIKVKGIDNIPSTIYRGLKTKLCPELDTGYGMDDQTALWDDREPTFRDVKYEITKGKDIATIDEDGVITANNDRGTITVRMIVPGGIQEKYTWYDKEFDQVDYVQSFNIELVNTDRSFHRARLWLKYQTVGDNISEFWVGIYNKAQWERLRCLGEPSETITINNQTFTRDSIVEVKFSDNFDWTDLSNFGRNWTNLVKINRIPESATNLRNFLRGCTSFNQPLTIPSNVNGDRCLESFLRDCTSFNSPIEIPSVNGFKCLESFLRGCTSFNRNITLPEEMTGDCCMYSFLQDCTSFNSTITLPKRISGIRCMENVLRNCENFNKNITLPEEISGHYNIAAFMFNCNSFDSCVTVPTIDGATNMEVDVITFTTYHKDSTIKNNGVDLYGDGAAKLKEIIGDNFGEDSAPYRKINVDGVEYVPEVETNFYGMGVTLDSSSEYGYYDDYVIGDTINYTAVIKNISDTHVTGVKLTNEIPSQILYKGASGSRDGITITRTYSDGRSGTHPLPDTFDEISTQLATTGDEPVTKVVVNIGDMSAGEEVTITINTIASELADTLINRVFINYDQEARDEFDNITDYVNDSIVSEHKTGDKEFETEKCTHGDTKIVGYIQPTATTKGYTGDTVCSKCGELIKQGSEIDVITAIGSDIYYGQKMSDSKINSDTRVPGTWKWETPETMPTEIDKYTMNAIFTPSREDGVVVTVPLEINVLKTTPTVVCEINPADITAGTEVTVTARLVNPYNRQLTDTPSITPSGYTINGGNQEAINDSKFTVPSTVKKGDIISIEVPPASATDKYNAIDTSTFTDITCK